MSIELPSGGRLGLLTCSMAGDLDLFRLLAASVDTHVAPDIRHYVVVPGADMPQFEPFRTARRDIIAQEDVLPEKLYRLPAWLRYFSFIRKDLRRPLYVAPGPRLVRGWMLQQFIKIEMARRAEEDAIMHVDSDVAFFRRLEHEDAFHDGRVRYFRVEGKTQNPRHGEWVASAAQFLGVPPPGTHDVHYIENCLLWSRDMARDMVARIESGNGKALHEVIFDSQSMSEYYVYGLFADLLAEPGRLQAENVSFCNSYWPSDDTAAVDFKALATRIKPKHCAIAVQSTHKLDVADRARIYARAEAQTIAQERTRNTNA